MRGLLRRLIIGIGDMGRRGISYRVACFGHEVLMYSLCFHLSPVFPTNGPPLSIAVNYCEEGAL
jgi:hypothetical protein